MVEKVSRSYRTPLREKSVNLHHSSLSESSASSSSSSRRWFSFKSRLSPRAPIETKLGVNHEKTVVLSLACPDASLTALLMQVCGGPIESACQLRSTPQSLIMLEFVFACHAQQFHAYVRRGKCVLNGLQVTVIDLLPAALDKLLRKAGRPQIERVTVVPTCARRTLQLFIPVSLPLPLSSSLRWEQRPPQLVRSRLDIRYLADVFGRLGNVLQVRPMIFCQHVAFAVDFDCISSAVKAKMQFDEEKVSIASQRNSDNVNSMFSGLEGWQLEYVRDHTEKACLM